MTRLIDYTKGEAKELVKHCIQQPTEVCYDNAKNLLMRRYGDPHKIMSKWPQVRQGDAAAYRKFYNFLLKCQSLTDGRKWNLFNSPDMLCTLVSKLPMSVGDRWNKKVQFTQKKQLREPDLADFIKFVEEETELVNDPLYSREAVDQHTERRERERKSFNKRDRRFKTLAIQLEEESKEKSRTKDTKDVVTCVKLLKNHDLEQCKAYLSKSVDERSKYLSTKKLCYGCLKPISKTHTTRSCNQRRTCKVCSEKNPTSLHGFKLKKKTNQAVNDTPDQSGTSQDGVLKSNVTVCDENIACASTKFSAQVISMCVVPVVIKHKDSTKEIITHAILDSCSQGTFIVEDLGNPLEIDGIDTSVVVKPLNCQSQLKSKLVNGLAVSNPIDKKFWIKLPHCYARKELPVDPEEIPTASETVQNPAVHAGVLIGANCLSALEPTEFIRSEAGGPYAYKTKLGWCIVGPIAKGNSGKETMTCSRIAVKEINSGIWQIIIFKSKRK